MMASISPGKSNCKNCGRRSCQLLNLKLDNSTSRSSTLTDQGKWKPSERDQNISKINFKKNLQVAMLKGKFDGF